MADATWQVPTTEQRLAGCLLGTALGDALGLACEGMSAAAIARRFGRPDRFRLLGQQGFVSDDTEQSALIAQSLIRAPSDVERSARCFRWSLLGWFLRLPWGIGLGTLRSCLKILIGLKQTGVRSAGNGAAMRSAIVGAAFCNDEVARRAHARAFAQVTHLDPRAVDGAIYVTDVAAACARAQATDQTTRLACHDAALVTLQAPLLVDGLRRAGELAMAEALVAQAVTALGTSGYVVHSVAIAAFCFVRFGDDPLRAIVETIAAGGDTDTNAAIVGGWVGALHGAAALPAALIDRINDGPFGPTHLRRLARALAQTRTRPSSGAPAIAVPSYSWPLALLRNLALYPVVLAHGFRRLLP
jgi:ADP-ribosyl-[dinitrogen reductase] hydrolase